MTPDQLRHELTMRAETIGGQNRLARAMQVTNGHLSRVIRGEKMPGPKVLRYLGLREVVTYERTSLLRRPIVATPLDPHPLIVNKPRGMA